MNKLMITAACAALMVSGAAFAQSVNDADIKADVQAIEKDDAAIRKQEDNLATNRAEKARAKAEGEYGRQASESLQIGANKTAREAKKLEKDVDKKILKHHKKKVSKDKGDVDTSVAPEVNN